MELKSVAARLQTLVPRGSDLTRDEFTRQLLEDHNDEDIRFAYGMLMEGFQCGSDEMIFKRRFRVKRKRRSMTTVICSRNGDWIDDLVPQNGYFFEISRRICEADSDLCGFLSVVDTSDERFDSFVVTINLPYADIVSFAKLLGGGPSDDPLAGIRFY
jgi:hypothetical protein